MTSIDVENIINTILNKPFPLSDEQKNAVLSNAKYLRIPAGPGSGKSEVLIRRIFYLILCRKVSAELIELIAFTNKNVETLKSAIYKRAESYGDNSLIDEINRLNIHTIDSLSKKIVQEYAGHANSDVITPERENALLIRYGLYLGIHDLPPEPSTIKMRKCKIFADTVDLIENEMVDLEDLKSTNPLFMEKMRNYYRFLKRHRLMTFKMMTRIAIEYLEREDSIKPDIKYLLIDEYQDINPAQDKLIRLLGRYADLFVVGDIFQTIYSWRGSHYRFFENFEKTYPSSATIKLQNNYRSKKDIVDLINDVKGTNIFSIDKSIDLCLKHTREGKNNIYSNVFTTDKEEAQWTVGAIENFISDGGSYKDIAIIFRSVKGYAEPFISELRRRNIPYSIAGKTALFIRYEVKTVAKLMAWLAPNGFFKDIGSNDNITRDMLLESALADWQTIFPNSNLDSEVKSQLEDWKEKTLSGGYDSFKSVYEVLLNILNFKQLDEADKEQRLMIINLGQFSALLDDVEYTLRLGGSKRRWNQDLTTLCYYLHQARYIYDSGSDELQDVDAVTISTIHQSKGLDWDCVFLPSLINGHLPSSQLGRARKYMIDTSSFDVERYDGTIEDEFFLYYTAISRARNTLICTYYLTKNYMKDTAISAFLEDSLQFDSITRLDGKSSFPDFQIEPTTHSGNELKSYSMSNIIQYNKCPYLHWLREKCGYSSKFSLMLGYGKALHFCLQKIAENTTSDIDPHTIVDEIVENNLYLPYAPNTKNAKEKGKDILHNYIDENPGDMINICDTEIPITINFHDYLVDGKIDVIIDDNGCKDVREYKTSDRVMSKEDISLQIQGYVLEITLNDNNSIIKGSVAFLDTGEVYAIKVDEESLKVAKKKIDDCVKGMRQGYYPPRPSKFCEDCDMINICKFAN